MVIILGVAIVCVFLFQKQDPVASSESIPTLFHAYWIWDVKNVTSVEWYEEKKKAYVNL